MNDFDKAARYTARLDPGGFLRWLLPGMAPALRFAGWLDTRTVPFPGERDRTCDTVAGIEHTAELDQHWAVVVEFQAEPDADMLDRLLEYLARLRRALRHGPQQRGKYQVMTALLNLTGPRQPDTLEMHLPDVPGVGLRLQTQLRTMREESAADTLAGIAGGQIAPCILPWVPLMHGAAEPGMIEEWKRLAGMEPDSRLRGSYVELALVFAELAGVLAEWERALEGWNVTESLVVLKWKAEALRAALLRALRVRFRISIPPELEAAVMAQTNFDELSHWFDVALTADSLDTFRAVIQN
jgi:hypothetical protein